METLKIENQTPKTNGHLFGLDIVRIIAMFLVVAVHSYHNGFYNLTEFGNLEFLSGVFRWVCMTCVSLFIILSGYLLKYKEPNGKYYKKLFTIILEYILCSLVCLLFRYFYHGSRFTIIEVVKEIVFFAGAPYSWYINMYLGLFLLAPFFNLAYNNIKEFRTKSVLIILLVIVFSMPNTSRYFPNFWRSAYPIMYYFIGMYLEDLKNRVKINKILLILTIVGISLLQSLLHLKSYAIFEQLNNHASIFCVLLSVAIFMLFYDVKCSNKRVEKVLSKISSLSLSTFLVSYIFDRLIYDNLLNHSLDFGSKIYHLLYMVPLIFICSVVLALIVNLILKLILKLFIKFKQVILSKKVA